MCLETHEIGILRGLINSTIVTAELYDVMDRKEGEIFSTELCLHTQPKLRQSESGCAYIKTKGDGQTPRVLDSLPEGITFILYHPDESFLKCVIRNMEAQPEWAGICGATIVAVNLIVLNRHMGAPTGVAIQLDSRKYIYTAPNQHAFTSVLSSIHGEPFPGPVTLRPV